MSLRDRRRSPRAPLNTPLLLLRENGHPVRAECENLAAGGLALRSEVELRVGERLHLSLLLRSPVEPLELVGDVAYVVALTHPAGCFRAGVEFRELGRETRALIEACVEQRLTELSRPTGS